jgi:hypothetical protein
MARKLLILDATIVGHLGPEPSGRLERIRGVLSPEFNLGNHQSAQATCIDIQFDRQVPGTRDQIPRLLKPATLNERP